MTANTPRIPMIRVFLDASALFAAVYSSSGSARDLLLLVVEDEVQVVVSQDVLDEVQRNLSRKVPEKVAMFQQLLALADPEVIADPGQEAVRSAEEYVVAKDAPIVAAAINAQPDYLVTYDRKHLLDPPTVAQRSGLTIVTPDVVIAAVQGVSRQV
jgi:putative PIN family toxin of toxin-antitoxin system